MEAAFDNPYLDTIISLALVYALLSILVSAFLESWNRRTKERGVFLQRIVNRLLDDPLNKNYGYLIYQHPIINAMRRDGNSYPHYLPAEGFANALIDTLAGEGSELRMAPHLDGRDVSDGLRALSAEERARLTYRLAAGNATSLSERLTKGVGAMKESEFKRLMTNFIERNSEWRELELQGVAGADDRQANRERTINMNALKDELGRWFDGCMERASGEFKNNQSNKLLMLGFAVALLLNVDSLHLAKVFLLDKDLRERMVSEAERVADAYEEMKAALGQDTLRAADYLAAASDHADTLKVRSDLARSQQLFLKAAKADSVFEKQSEEVLLMVRNWQLPLGWNPGEAPLSWFTGKRLKQVPSEYKPSQRAVLEHFRRRNTWSPWNALKWLIGITITAYSLRLGAPFWFQVLVKLINIRRSGAVPKTMDERKAR
ncbi:MAG: hypothetical protein IPM12_02610 [Flavobacteriales bacterium]|nr:hypothetical protein [Flavobacteriales bacterium]